MQLHFRLELSRRVEFVLISRLRIAASSSERTVEAPCMDVPPVMFIFVFWGAGEDVREGFWEEVLLFEFLDGLKSEINGPAAEGGGLGVGVWMTGGLGLSAKAFLLGLEEEEVAGRLDI
jgi:hypothetical protein